MPPLTRTPRYFRPFIACLALIPALLLPHLSAQAQNSTVGADVAAAFARAREGRPLRYVALGGSITQGGAGWIGPWLRKTFPRSLVTTVNSGISATGSQLGIFRVDRDVISYQPDLVAIEYCVNDSGLSDEDAVRYMESLIVRLKSLPNPPAIIILEAAAKGGVNLARHRRVAQHYGLLEVDLQAAADAKVAAGAKWEDIFGDNVHPNAQGHALYAEVIEKALAPFVDQPAGSVPRPLPAPLSQKPLILDGRMVALSSLNGVPDWKVETSFPSWWDRVINGTLTAEKPGTTLRYPFQGTIAGLFYLLNKDQGAFYGTVDGALPSLVSTNTRDGYTLTVLANDLPARQHVLDVVLPQTADPILRQNGPVRLAYLLVGGETQATLEQSPSGPFTTEMLRSLHPTPILPGRWSWSSPAITETPARVETLLDVAFPPENGDAAWKPVPEGKDYWVEAAPLLGEAKSPVLYAKTTFDAAQAGHGYLALEVDYFAKLWLNGQLVHTADGPHGMARSPIIIPVDLRQGGNEILLKAVTGTQGFGFGLSVMESRL